MDFEVLKKTHRICIILTFANILAVFLAVFLIPVFSGAGNSISDRKLLLLFPVLSLVLNLVYNCGVLRKKNEKSNYSAISKIYLIVEIAYIAMSWALVWFYFNSKRDGAFDLYNNILFIIGGLGFIFIGNFMPQVKQCKGLGLKTKWTKNNEVCWNKTHRLLGRLIMTTGIIELIISLYDLFTNKISSSVIFAVMITGTVLSFGTACIYAYRHRND